MNKIQPRFSAQFVRFLIRSSGLILLLVVPVTRPALAQLVPSDDSYTQQGAPNANNGSATTLILRGSATAQHNAYIRFNLSSLPAGLTSSNISTATMTLFVSTVTTAGSFD